MPISNRRSGHPPASGDLRLPGQFKPDRTLDEAPFGFWVRLMLAITDLTEEDLIPTREDLELISELAFRTDELGSRLAAEILKDPKVARQLQKGLVEGTRSLADPSPTMVEFLEYYENMPDFFGGADELRRSGHRSPFISMMPGRALALVEAFTEGSGMAVGFYVGGNYPAVGQSIVATRSVATGTSRMNQTLNFVADIFGPNSFRKRGPGVQACAKVRLAHAFARHQIAEGDIPWDEDYYGAVISEFDNMIFLSGFLSLGYHLDRLGIAGAETVSKILKAIQYGLGAPEALMAKSMDETFRFFVMVLAHLDDSPETARQIVQSFERNKLADSDGSLGFRLNREFTFFVANLATRFLYGNAMANDLALPERVWGVPVARIASLLSSGVLATAPSIQASGVGARLRSAVSALEKLGKKAPALPAKPEGRGSQRPSERRYEGSFGAFGSS